MGRLLVIGFVGSVLLGLAALIALLGLEGGAGGNNFVPGGTTAANLPEAGGPGANLVVRYCSHCHNLPAPQLHSAEQWPMVVERMRLQMGAQMMNRAPTPSPEEQQALVEYMQRHALR